MAAARFPWYWREDVHRVWEILRRRGFIYFLFVRGVLRWGGFMFNFTVLMTLLGVFHRDLFLSALLRTGSICVLGGLAWAPLRGAAMSGCIENMAPARPNHSLNPTARR